MAARRAIKPHHPSPVKQATLASFTTLQQEQSSRSKRARGEKMIPMGILALAAAVCAYFWSPVAMMHAPGAAGRLICRAAFEAFPELYCCLLRTFGPAEAAFLFRHLPRWLIRLLASHFGMCDDCLLVDVI
ncbi:unnamed protein product [Triticum turgidum subsp. durum]|uniref:Uncharacterized protein n=1 Tax=Triticum turgidum subsp. durum TaxID=4567 RepID=A0A9R0RY33_TRITD|nr:unnamed protein product [Triticum turgidum subsp. durum]